MAFRDLINDNDILPDQNIDRQRYMEVDVHTLNPRHIYEVEHARYNTFCHYGRHTLQKYSDFVKLGKGDRRKPSFKICWECMPTFLDGIQKAINSRFDKYKSQYTMEIKWHGINPISES